jgi:hypothetical protein
MKVISELNGEVVLQIPTEQIYPKEGAYLPEIVAHIASRYQFTSYTDLRQITQDELREKGIQFQMGKFVNGAGSEAFIKSFNLWDWAVGVTAHNTTVAEEFVNDVLATLADSYAFRRDPVEGARMLFGSQLLVQFDNVFDNALRAFDVIAKSLETAFLGHYNTERTYRLNALGLDFDKLIEPKVTQGLYAFAIERRIHTSFDENKYFCKAPFRTPDHVRLLTEVESLFLT